MTSDEASDAARAVTEFLGRLAKEPHVAAEIQRARRDFFAADAAAAPALPGGADMAELRFAEWFTLERDSEVLGAVPVEVPAWSGDAADLGDSLVGLWLVQEATRRGVAVRDLQDGHTLDFEVPPASLQAGDLVVGRVFAEGAGRFTPSVAAAIFRPGASLAQAFVRDMERLGLERRLQQVELEHLLLRRPATTSGATAPALASAAPAAPAIPLEHLEADLDAVLLRSGSEHTAAALSQQLAMAVRPGQVMGPLLDELAFETDVDLDRTRELLLAIWNAHHRDAGGGAEAPADASTPPGETLGERLVRTLDEGLSQQRDVGELFAQLERMAGIEPDPDEDDLFGAATADDEEDGADAADRSRRVAHGVDDDDDDDGGDDDGGGDDERIAAPAPRRAGPRPRAVDPADPDAAHGSEATDGNLAALVEEYLWEAQLGAAAAAADLRLFASLQDNAPLPHRDLEEVTAADVMRVLLHVYLGAAPDQRAACVRTTFAALRGFYQWADEVQEMGVAGVLAGCQGALLDHLDRLQAAGQALSSGAIGNVGRPGVLVVEEVGKQGFGVRDDDGAAHWLTASAAAVAGLRAGDLVLGAMTAPVSGKRQLAGLAVVLPADARALME